MTVAQLIGILMSVKNKNLSVFIEDYETSNLHDVTEVDFQLNDRFRIHLGQKLYHNKNVR